MSFFLPVFKKLNTANVRYVVVGGIATILHGYIRATADIDLIVDLQVEEAQKVIKTLTQAGYKARVPADPMDFANAEIRELWIQTKGMTVFSLYDPEQLGLSIDLFVKHPIPFEDMWQRSIVMDIEGINVRVCSIDDLIELKRIAGRDRDAIDIKNLMKIKAQEQ